ncbi:hypothetical protein LRH25_13670 [Ideonella azotifigens]|uniref:Uncharacterized protein n=1 Tax=Ideonella azotifigens TaxID=513160 RepID=A0ABN1JYM7_9BURK|nr:hypothetical protein [Ideonella azotifigens]MCD2341391.1 hypothetical protein [Ideonella azotifigens]
MTIASPARPQPRPATPSVLSRARGLQAAQTTLAPMLARFDEGHDARDLREAATLLAALKRGI